MESEDELRAVCGEIHRMLAYECWDSTTRSSLVCYLKLRGISYIAEDHLTDDSCVRMVLKIGGKIYSVTIGGMIPVIKDF